MYCGFGVGVQGFGGSDPLKARALNVWSLTVHTREPVFTELGAPLERRSHTPSDKQNRKFAPVVTLRHTLSDTH